ncbi:MAG: response regulator [Thermotogota bacterium]|nr:response regulator [Thermotogota bacterium]
MKEFRVLVVDDEDDFREIFIKRLKKREFNVTGAESGEKALQILDKQLFDVVILDVKMPGMDGVETLKEMKRMRPLMEVIMLTGHSTVESAIDGMKLGAFDYIMKPADLDELLEKMSQAYEKKRAHEQKIQESRLRELEVHPGRVFEHIKEK